MERWYWIELIGFDNESPDFGVGSFLERNVTTTGVSLLFSHVDFLFKKAGEPLPVTACSYCGHEYNRERRRQDWTEEQLYGLVQALKKRGVKVFFSSFDMTKSITDPAWLCYRRDGVPGRTVYPVKRIGSRLVGEAIIDRIAEVLERYGFDGFHLADGLSSNRYSIDNSDFSLSFCADSGIEIPKELMEEGTDAYAARREWILKHAEVRWVQFVADRWAALYDKLFEKIKKPVMFNNAWTRNSFEALYRYGLDYRRCHAEDAFAVMIEENSATRAITAACDEGGVEYPLSHRKSFPYEYALMQQDIRISTKGLKQISLTPISDTLEQWDALRHCPTELMRSIVRRYNNFVFRNGRFEVCSDAPLYCLSDGIAASDWRWLASVESYRIPMPDKADGFALVVNTDALDRDLAHFCESRHYFGTALANELAMGGLNLGLQIPLSEIGDFTGARCLVVTDLGVYTEEQKRMLTQARLPILVIGEEVELPLAPVSDYRGDYISVALYNAEGILSDFSPLCGLERVIEPQASTYGGIWTAPLSYKRVEERFFAVLCRILNKDFGADYSEDPEVKVFSMRAGNARYVFLSNDEYVYNVCTVHTAAGVISADALMKDRGYRVKIGDNCFTVRIPPRCMEIVRVEE